MYSSRRATENIRNMDNVSESEYTRQLNQPTLCLGNGEGEQPQYIPMSKILTSNRYNAINTGQYQNNDITITEYPMKQGDSKLAPSNTILYNFYETGHPATKTLNTASQEHLNYPRHQLQQPITTTANCHHLSQTSGPTFSSKTHKTQSNLNIMLEQTPEMNVPLESSSCTSSNAKDETWNLSEIDLDLEDIDLSAFSDDWFQGEEDNFTSDVSASPLLSKFSNDQYNQYSGANECLMKAGTSECSTNATATPCCDEQQIEDIWFPPSCKRTRYTSNVSSCSGMETTSQSSDITTNNYINHNSLEYHSQATTSKVLERQMRNNAASKRSRERRKRTFQLEEATVQHLLAENAQMELELRRMELMLEKCRNIIQQRFQILASAHETRVPK